jgi:SNF2 family DNA or RNA helicase
MKIQATVVGNRIHVRSPGIYIKALSKSIPGANWSKTSRAWTLPLSMDSCRALREYCGASLEILPPLWLWAREAVTREQTLGDLGRRLSGVELRRVPEYPAMAKAMANRPYQAAAARFVAEGRSVLIADTPGLGKTLEAIAGCVEAANEPAGPYLVCAPQTSLEVVWERELQMWLPEEASVFVVDGSKGRRDKTLAEALDPEWDLSTTWVIVNIEMLRTKSFWTCPECGQEWQASDHPRANIIDCGHDPKKAKTRSEHKFPQLFSQTWGGIIMDECQRSLIRTSGTPTQTRAGAMLLQTRSDGVRIALSGTPMRGRSQRLWGTLNWLRRDLHTGFWSWVERYWYVDKHMGIRTIGDLRLDRAGALSKSLDGMVIRRTKAEVSPELPAKQYMGSALDPRDPDESVAVWLPMTSKQQRAYNEMLKFGSARVKGGVLNAVGILAELTRLKQFANCYGEMKEESTEFQPALPSNKFDWLVQFLTERSIIDPDEAPTGKVVVVSQFTQILDVFADALAKLGARPLYITGNVTGRKRQAQVDAFNDMDSGFNVLFLNTTAGGVSITLDAADDMVFLDETWIPDDQEQAEDRINNRRPEEKIATRRYWYLKSIGSVDESIAITNLHMDQQQKELLDGRRGIAYIREVFKEVTK